MPNPEHLAILKQGVNIWNEWRSKGEALEPDLSSASLSRVNLVEANLSRVSLSEAYLRWGDLSGANLSKAKLIGATLTSAVLNGAMLRLANLDGAKLSNASLTWANLIRTSLKNSNLTRTNFQLANLTDANLRRADLSNANLSGANLHGAILCEAYFRGANLRGANLSNADLTDADFRESEMGWTTLANNDLSVAKGLETVRHVGPSTVGIDTIYRSGAKLPKRFLRGCGVSENLISFLPSIIGAEQVIQFYSCFISHSHKDGEFAERLYSRMRDENLRVWYAPEEMKGGRKLHEEVFKAIQIHDKLLLVLSKNSLQSDWVATEIRRAKRVESEENRRKLFPIRLVDFESIKKWECFDADSGKDLAVEVREYYIPDFSNWRDRGTFELEFGKLLTALTAEGNSISGATD